VDGCGGGARRGNRRDKPGTEVKLQQAPPSGDMRPAESY
jgi:hypothetical protein